MISKRTYFCGVAAAVLALAASPAGAQLLSIGDGDGGLLDLGGSGTGGDAGVSVDVDLGSGGDAGGDADVDVDLGSVTGGGDDGGGLEVDLFGTGETDATVSADLFDDDGNLGVDGNEVVVDLDAGGNDADVLLDLFGAGGGNMADVDASLLGDDGAGSDVTVDIGGVGGTDPALDLFGEGGGGDEGVVIDLFGETEGGGGGGVDDTTTGSLGGSQTADTGGGEGAGGSVTFAPGAAVEADARLVANADAGIRADCFSPDETQIGHLLARNSYDASVAATWDEASAISVVPVELCPDARGRVAAAIGANAEIGFMQAQVASIASIRSAITPEYGPDDVLAVDQDGERLTVYVF